MHRGHPQALLGICRGLLSALRAMGYHLATPSLLRNAGKKVNRFPAPAACTELALFDVEFVEYHPERAEREGPGEVVGKDDDVPAGVPGIGEQITRCVANADAHSTPRGCT